jgi:hypothetical protein
MDKLMAKVRKRRIAMWARLHETVMRHFWLGREIEVLQRVIYQRVRESFLAGSANYVPCPHGNHLAITSYTWDTQAQPHLSRLVSTDGG